MAGTIFVLVGICCAGLTVALSPCEDNVQCKLYAQEICTDSQYLSWTTSNCARYCGICTDATQAPQSGVGKFMDENGGVPACRDSIDNCKEYGMKICTDVKFFSWVDDNCKAHCNRCVNVCEDKALNCADYGETLCTELSYYNWVEMNCRKYCARCS